VISRPRAALAGILSVAAALGLSELLAGILSGATSLIAAVGQFVVDHQPPGAKDFVVSLFGTNDKLALEVLIVIVALGIGAGLAIAGRRWPLVPTIGFVAFGVIGFFAAIGDPLASPTLTGITAAVSTAAGLWVLDWLVRAATPPATAVVRKQPLRGSAAMPDWARRTFLIQAAAVGVGATVAGAVGRTLLDRQSVSPGSGAPPLPPPSETVPALSPGEDLSPGIDGLTPIVMPNSRFYRIDTALLVPNVDASTWSLRIHGMVDRETTLTYAELSGLPMFEQYVTISCVSNEVGGDLVGNAKWTGVRLRDVLAMAGVQAGATQIVGRPVSDNDFTAGMPTAWVMDPSREPMIALKMNDEPLPRAHGYPARLIVPGLYGYVSATKWLAEIELTTLEAFDGYWVPLGWAKLGPILTQSRIDTPGSGANLKEGRVPIAGIAWAPDRGIGKVEVSIDGTWYPAMTSAPIDDATWVQWVLYWDAKPGQHTIMVRATDGKGETQPQDPTPPAPDGARGWHTVGVLVG
jgi:DMSO/TMAO reductase YedYZ molybdopterin-dependent catalytic subunit